MALTGTEALLMTADIDDATRSTAAAVVTQHVEGHDLLLVLHRLGYKLKTTPVFDLDPVTATCRNGHPKNAANRGRTANGVAFCISCDADRKAARIARERAATDTTSGEPA